MNERNNSKGRNGSNPLFGNAARFGRCRQFTRMALASLLLMGAFDMLRANAIGNRGEWPTGGGDDFQTYYSPLARINASNAKALGFAWSYDLDTTHGLESTPVVVAGVMYATGPLGFVHAIDAKTGRGLWTFDPHVDASISSKVCCDVVNRGLAVAHGRVFVASTDGRLFALDALTGRPIWQVDTIIDHGRGYTVTGAVYLANDLAVIGNSGAEFDARGYVSAYDIRTGALRWRLFTVPASAKGPFENPELEAAARTWDPQSRWEVGGGGTVWDGMAYDPHLNLLYVGTGNAESYPHTLRSPAGGDNLYTSSVLAICADTGRLAWYYQEVPADQWDFDSDATIVLATLRIQGRRRRVLLHAPKDGFFYVLDRITGTVLSAEPYVPVTWASSVDKRSGQPIQTGQGDYSREPRLVFPSLAGGHNWQPMAFNPHTQLVYIPAIEAGAVYWMPAQPFIYQRGAGNTGALMVWPARNAGEAGLESQVAKTLPSLTELAHDQPDTTIRGYLRAWDPVANRVAWQVETSDRWSGEINAMWNGGGIMTSAGNLVFQGRSTGFLHVYRADTGEQLTAINVGTSIMAAPMTYELGGTQYVAVLAGFGGGLGRAYPEGTAARRYGNAGRVVVFKLGGGAVPLPPELPQNAELPRPSIERSGPPELVERGNELFARNCSLCHRNESASGSVPDLRRMTAETHAEFEDIVLRGSRAAKGMGSFAHVLSEEDAQAIHAALIDAAWRQFELEHPARHSTDRP